MSLIVLTVVLDWPLWVLIIPALGLMVTLFGWRGTRADLWLAEERVREQEERLARHEGSALSSSSDNAEEA